MHQAVLVNANIHEGPEVGHVSDGTFQHHAQLQILEGFDALSEFSGLELRARVATGLIQLFENIAYGRHTKALIGEVGGLERFEGGAVANQPFHVAAVLLGNALYQRVGQGGSLQVALYGS